MPPLQLRQGDVLLVRIPELPPDLRPLDPDEDGRVVLARSHPGGHRHALAADRARLFEQAATGRRFLKIDGPVPADLMHEEHRAIAVMPGLYAVHHQCEYRPPLDSHSLCRVPVGRWPRTRVRCALRRHPHPLDLADVRGEPDPDLRRILIARYGPGRIMGEPPGRLERQDAFGRLWRFDDFDGEALVMVEVRNATPERDGSFRDYWLRVPPPMRSPHEAVAWTFDLTAESYGPAVQS